MPIIHLIRHGETASSGHCYAGRQDVPLTAQGHAQAQALAALLQDRPLAAVFSSPLQRALDTARPLADRTGCAISLDPDLAEFDFGDLEGRPKADLSLSLRKAHLHDPVPGGESLGDLWERTGRVAGRLLRLPMAELAVVGHHWTNRLLYGHLTRQSLPEAARARHYRPAVGSLVTLATGPSAIAAPAPQSSCIRRSTIAE